MQPLLKILQSYKFRVKSKNIHSLNNSFRPFPCSMKCELYRNSLFWKLFQVHPLFRSFCSTFCAKIPSSYTSYIRNILPKVPCQTSSIKNFMLYLMLWFLASILRSFQHYILRISTYLHNQTICIHW